METRLKKSDSTALKGVAILLMLFHHCFRTADKYAGYDVIFFPLQENWVINIGIYSKICVSLFAFVSGYGLMHGYSRLLNEGKTNHTAKWIGTRIVSTLSGYWFIAPLAYIVYGFVNGFGYGKWGENRIEKIVMIFADMAGLSGVMDTTSVNGAWWYISTAIIFVILIPVLVTFMNKFGDLACVLLIFSLPRILGIGFLGGSNTYSFLMVFVIGMLCCKYDFFAKFEKAHLLKHDVLNDMVKFCVLLFIILFGIWSFRKVSLSLFWEYRYAIIPFFVILFFVEYVFRIRIFKTILEFLGMHSYNIWLVHSFVRDYLADYVWSVKYFLVVPLVILLISLVISMGINFLKRILGYDEMIKKLVKRIEMRG